MDENRRCKATSKQSGERCKRAASVGGTVCKMHGGAAPQVKRAAAERATRQGALAEAQRMVALAGVDMDPIQHLLEALHTAYQLKRVWGAMVAAIDAQAEAEAEASGTLRGELRYREAAEDSYDELVVIAGDRMLALNYRGEAQVHPYMVEYQHAVDRHAKFAKLCIDAGIAERQVRIIEAQVEIVQRAFEAALDAANLNSGQRQEARQTYARHLRLVA